MVVSKVLRELWNMASLGRLRCIGCGVLIPLNSLEISMYPHDRGIPLEEDGNIRFWIYFTCPRCGYQNSATRVMEVEKL